MNVARLSLADAVALLKSKFGIEIIPCFLTMGTGRMSSEGYQVGWCDYRSVPGYEKLIAVEVLKGAYGHQVERFNIVGC